MSETRRGRDLLGLPVYAVREGTRLGDVVSLLVRREDSTVTVVGVEGPGGRHYLPLRRFQVIGPDAVLLDAEAALAEALPAEAVRDLDHALVGRAVISEGGQKLGVVIGFRVDPADGRIDTYRVRPNEGIAARLAALMTGDRLEVPVSEVVAVGPDSLMVRESAPSEDTQVPTPLPPV